MSGIQGLIYFILTIFLFIIFNFLNQDSSIIEVYNNTKFNEYIWPFLVFICMATQNILQILILYFFKPSFICIIYAFLPLLNFILSIFNYLFKKESKWKYKEEIKIRSEIEKTALESIEINESLNITNYISRNNII